MTTLFKQIELNNVAGSMIFEKNETWRWHSIWYPSNFTRARQFSLSTLITISTSQTMTSRISFINETNITQIDLNATFVLVCTTVQLATFHSFGITDVLVSTTSSDATRVV